MTGTHTFSGTITCTKIYTHIPVCTHTFIQTTMHTITRSLSLSQGYMVVASYIFRRSIYLCLRWFHPFCISSPLQAEPFSAGEHKRQNEQWSSRGRPSEPVNEDKWPLPSSLSFVFTLFISACPPHFSFHYFCSPPSLLFSTSNSPFIFLMTPPPPSYLRYLSTFSCYLFQSVLLSVSFFIHSLLTLFTPLSLCRTALGCVFGRGSGSSWLISVYSTTKVGLCSLCNVDWT